MGKKLFILSVLLFFGISSNAQEFSYGITGGVNGYNIATKNGPLSSVNDPYDNLNIGLFGGYQFSDRLGVKARLLYNSSNEEYAISDNFVFSEFSFDVKTIQFLPHLKLDVNSEYGKGFYLVAGPRLSIVTNAENEAEEDVKDFYNSSSLGVQLGFGVDFLKHFSIELFGDYGLNNILSDQTDTEANTAGAYILFSVDFDSFLK